MAGGWRSVTEPGYVPPELRRVAAVGGVLGARRQYRPVLREGFVPSRLGKTETATREDSGVQQMSCSRLRDIQKTVDVLPVLSEPDHIELSPKCRDSLSAQCMGRPARYWIQPCAWIRLNLVFGKAKSSRGIGSL